MWSSLSSAWFRCHVGRGCWGGLLILCVGCATTKPAAPESRTLPAPLVAAELPERPDTKKISGADDWAIPVADGDTVPQGRAGVLMSMPKAARAARYVISYNELRGLYLIDLRTWGRERKIYERHLTASEAETERWRENAKRDWWEQHSSEVGVTIGIVVGVAATVSIVAAVHGTEGVFTDSTP